MNGYGRGEDNRKKDKNVITRETIGMTLLLFSTILLVITIIGKYIFGEIGVAITAFLMGLFGFFIYPLLASLIYFSVVLVSGKSFISAKWVARAAAVVCSVFLIVHLATSARFCGNGYGAYLSGCWNAPFEGVGNSTGGGAVFGLVVYPVRFLLSQIGSYVLFSLLLLVSVFFFLYATPIGKAVAHKVRTQKQNGESERGKEVSAPADIRPSGIREYPGAVAFDDLEPPVPQYNANEYGSRGAQYNAANNIVGGAPNGTPRYDAPYGGRNAAQQPYRTNYPPQQPPVYAEEKPAEQPAEQPYTPTGRDILFSSDPASNYRNNLIFNRESAFNSQPRKSTVNRNAEGQRAQTPAETQTTANSGAAVYERAVERTPQSYETAYKEQAETPRPAMPRKIVEQKPAQSGGYSLRAEELNYPQVPSYKAPDLPAEPSAEPRDFYANDVPYEEFSSAPHIDDVPDEPVLENPADDFVEPEIPAQRKVKRASAVPEPEPTEDVLPERSVRDLFAEPDSSQSTAADGFGGETLGRDFGRGEDVGREQFDARDGLGGGRTVGFGDTNVFGGTEFLDRSERTPSDRGGRLSPDEEDPMQSRAEQALRGRSSADLFDDDDDGFIEEDLGRSLDPVPSAPKEREIVHEIPDAPAPKPKKHVYKAYRYPSMDLFRQYDDAVKMPPEEIDRNSAIIVETLAGFRVDAEIIKVTVGPSVTRYDIDIPRNISVRSVIKHDEEIAMRLHARDGVNIYSNSEVGLISIEVPNSVRAVVGIRSVMESEEYRNSKLGALMFAIGKDVEGRNVCGNIPKMTHILVAGSTNSGKSVCLNAMLVSLICKYSPEELRLILIDPKKVEFTVYDGLPHLMINEIIADAQKAVSALNWAIKEMERRYGLFEQKTRTGIAVRNLDEYNDNLTEDEERLAKIVIVVDELADLMAVSKKDIEERIQRLTQKARAAGIHLVIATQRPSVDVITGVIKGNLPTRMAFRVIQEVDSRTILDESGAEKLLGNGDMLYKTGGMFTCSRVQGAFLSSEEVQNIVSEIKANNEAYFDPEVADYINKTDAGGAGASDDDADDETVSQEYIKALAISVKLGSTSISLIQRKCSVGYNHAGKIIEWMELMGYITPFDGKAKARTVLLTKEEFEGKYGSLD